jgi:large subunit ribosomal protein L23
MGKEQKAVGFSLEAHQVLIKPLVTEKGVHRATRDNQYAFQVHTSATKVDIKQAVESLFEVKVDKVRTQNRKGKSRRYRYRVGHTGAWKRALVTLVGDDRIEFI